jgi:D-lactate dehydrogenase
MTENDIRALFASVAPFSASDAPTLEALVARARAVEVPADQDAFREGDPAPFVFVVARGAFEVRKRAEDGSDVALRTLEVGAVGGLTNLAGDAPRSATLRASRDGALLVVEKNLFVEAMRRDAALTAAVLRALGEKIRSKTAQVATLIDRTRRDPREKIVFFDAKPYERESFDRLLPESLRIRYVQARLGPTTARLADGFSVVCAFVNDDLSRPVLEELAARGVRLVAMRCAGYNNVELAVARELGLSVVRVPAYSPYAVAEHTVALLLTLVRKTHKAYARVREGNFSLSGLVGFDLHEKTVAVIGTGKIGAVFATILRGFGARVLAFDQREDPALIAAGVRYAPLDVLLSESDVLSLHVPLNPSTYHLIDRDRLAKMKRGVVLLNTSRGGLVDTAALIDALKSEHVGAAGLDVYEEESEYFFQDRSDRVTTDDVLARLMTFPNVLITSHQAFLTREALENIAEATLSSVEEFLSARPLTRAV